MKLAFLLLVGCAGVLPKENPVYGIDVLNPGVKLAYTWGGKGGGFTYGFELSALFPTGTSLSAIVAAGPDINFTWRHGGTFDLRLGLDLVSWFVGIELGPGLVEDKYDHAHASFGLTTWASFIWVDPYWTYTWVHSSENLSEWGAYAKLPICLGGQCDYSGGGHHDSHH